MTRSRSIGLWLTSLALVSLSASLSWGSYSISNDAGGGTIEATGFAAYPVIGAIVALQVSAFLVSLIVKNTVTRVISVALLPLMGWSFLDVLVSSAVQVESTLSRFLAEQTGVEGEGAALEFVTSSSFGFGWVFYLVAVVVNVVALIIRIFVPLEEKPKKASAIKRDLPDDLWSEQK